MFCLILCAEKNNSGLPFDFLWHNLDNLDARRKAELLSAIGNTKLHTDWAIPGSTWPASHPSAALTIIP